MAKRLTKTGVNKAHKAMMAGLRREYKIGVTTKTEYDRLRRRAVQLHKEDLLRTN